MSFQGDTERVSTFTKNKTHLQFGVQNWHLDVSEIHFLDTGEFKILSEVTQKKEYASL